jgi:hypothetical protein
MPVLMNVIVFIFDSDEIVIDVEAGIVTEYIF